MPSFDLFDSLRDAQHCLAHGAAQHHLPAAHPSEAALQMARSGDWTTQLTPTLQALEALKIFGPQQAARDCAVASIQETFLYRQARLLIDTQNWGFFGGLFSPQTVLRTLSQTPPERRSGLAEVWSCALLAAMEPPDERIEAPEAHVGLHPLNLQRVTEALAQASAPSAPTTSAPEEETPLDSGVRYGFQAQQLADCALLNWRLNLEWAATHCAALGLHGTQVPPFPGLPPERFSRLVDQVAQAPWFQSLRDSLSLAEIQHASTSFFSAQWVHELRRVLDDLRGPPDSTNFGTDQDADFFSLFHSASAATKKTTPEQKLARETQWLEFQQHLLSVKPVEAASPFLSDALGVLAAPSASPPTLERSESAPSPLAALANQVWKSVHDMNYSLHEHSKSWNAQQFLNRYGRPFRLLQTGLPLFPALASALIDCAQTPLQQQTSKDWMSNAMSRAKLNGVPSETIVHAGHTLLACLPQTHRPPAFAASVARAALALTPKMEMPGNYHQDSFTHWAHLSEVLDSQRVWMPSASNLSSSPPNQGAEHSPSDNPITRAPKQLRGLASCVQLALSRPLDTPAQSQAVLSAAGVALLRVPNAQPTVVDLLTQARQVLQQPFESVSDKKNPSSAAAYFAASLPEQQRFARLFPPTPMVLRVLESLVDPQQAFTPLQANNLVESVALGHTHPLAVEMAITLAGPALDLSTSSIVSKAAQRLDSTSSHSVAVLKLLVEHEAPLRIEGSTAKRFDEELFSWTESRDLGKALSSGKGKSKPLKTSMASKSSEEAAAGTALVPTDRSDTESAAPTAGPPAKPRGRRL